MNKSDSSDFKFDDDDSSLKEIFLKLKDLFELLKRKWVLIFIAGIIGGGLGLLYSFLKKPVYTAVLTYALEDEKSGSGLTGALGLASTLGFDLGTSAGGAFGSANLMELMHSRSLIEKTLLSTVTINNQKTTLVDYYMTVNKIFINKDSENGSQKITFPVNIDRAKFSRSQDSLLGVIATDIDKDQLAITQKDKKISIGTIEVKSTNEQFSKLFCEGLVKEVSTFYINSKSRKAQLNVSILSKQADSVRNELNGAINGVAKSNDQTYNLNPAMNANRIPSVKRQIDVQANTAILTQLIANLEMAKVSLRKETPLVQIIDSPILPLKREIASKKKWFVIGFVLASFVLILFIGIKAIVTKILS